MLGSGWAALRGYMLHRPGGAEGVKSLWAALALPLPLQSPSCTPGTGTPV